MTRCSAGTHGHGVGKPFKLSDAAFEEEFRRLWAERATYEVIRRKLHIGSASVLRYRKLFRLPAHYNRDKPHYTQQLVVWVSEETFRALNGRGSPYIRDLICRDLAERDALAKRAGGTAG